MKFFVNLIWFICGGLWLGLSWAMLGLLLCLTIIGIPMGRQCFKAAKLTFAPFGKKVICNFNKHPVANILWVILVGWEMAMCYFFSGLICCITIIGIPLGLRAFKLMKLAFAPFGATIAKG